MNIKSNAWASCLFAACLVLVTAPALQAELKFESSVVERDLQELGASLRAYQRHHHMLADDGSPMERLRLVLSEARNQTYYDDEEQVVPVGATCSVVVPRNLVRPGIVYLNRAGSDRSEVVRMIKVESSPTR